MPLKEHMRTHHHLSTPTTKDLSFNMSSPFSLQVNQQVNQLQVRYFFVFYYNFEMFPCALSIQVSAR